MWRWPRGTLYPQKLAITSPTNGGRSFGTVSFQTKATEYVCICNRRSPPPSHCWRLTQSAQYLGIFERMRRSMIRRVEACTESHKDNLSTHYRHNSWAITHKLDVPGQELSTLNLMPKICPAFELHPAWRMTESVLGTADRNDPMYLCRFLNWFMANMWKYSEY
jgi:hypothetical protein